MQGIMKITPKAEGKRTDFKLVVICQKTVYNKKKDRNN